MDTDLVAYLAITRLHGRYADIATRLAWSEMPAIATPDAKFTFDLRSGPPLELEGPDAVAAFGAQACAQFSFYNYTPLNSVTTLTDDTHATGRAYALEVGVDRTSGAWVEFYGRYDDRYEVHEGEWRFARRHYRTMVRKLGDETTTFEEIPPGGTAGPP